MTIIFDRARLDSRAGLKVRVADPNGPLSVAEVVQRWRGDTAFTDAFTRVIADCPWSAVFFETPAVTWASLDQAFEFVLLDAPSLARVRADPRAFARYLEPEGSIATFENLRADAVLVAPCDLGADCAHLASFTRSANPNQLRALWRAVAEVYEAELREDSKGARRWLSTSGLGVHWLHVRIDTRPKYYNHRPYRGSSEPTLGPRDWPL